jgi:hypothetical protein
VVLAVPRANVLIDTTRSIWLAGPGLLRSGGGRLPRKREVGRRAFMRPVLANAPSELDRSLRDGSDLPSPCASPPVGDRINLKRCIARPSSGWLGFVLSGCGSFGGSAANQAEAAAPTSWRPTVLAVARFGGQFCASRPRGSAGTWTSRTCFSPGRPPLRRVSQGVGARYAFDSASASALWTICWRLESTIRLPTKVIAAVPSTNPPAAVS